MGRFVNPDNSAFQAALNSRIYVDKTGMIEYMNRVLETTDAYICNSRPRRFGKSYAANMLAAYYSKGADSEKMCQDYLLYYADNLPIELSEIGQWCGNDSKRKKQIQIDIVGTPVEGKDYIIGSCKYRNEKIGVDELDLIRDYASVFGKGNNYHYYIFSKGGFTEGLLQAQERGEVRLITLEDLYK